MYKFFVSDNEVNEDEINIIEDVNHIKNVLRLGIGEKVEVCDSRNCINYLCEIVEADNKFVKCKILDKLENSREPNVYLHIFQGLPKAEKMETIIQKTTEIGVSEITPVVMRRCVVKLDNKSASKKVERWQKIAEVAAKQSKRDKIPQINLPIDLKNIYKNLENYDIVLVAYENEENNGIKQILSNVSKKQDLRIAVIIGPEGGIDDSEISELKSHNIQTVSLGKRILRTETAPIVLSSVIMYEFDEMM